MGTGATQAPKGAPWATWNKLDVPGSSAPQPPSQPEAGGSKDGGGWSPGASGEGQPHQTSESGAQCTTQLQAEASQLLRRDTLPYSLCACCAYVSMCLCVRVHV